MTPKGEPPTRREIKDGRPVQRAADRLAREADRMQERSEELGAEIERARSDWQRKRTDEGVPGANPPESDEGLPPEASFPAKDDDSEAESEDQPREG
jgi:hypothetical protein